MSIATAIHAVPCAVSVFLRMRGFESVTLKPHPVSITGKPPGTHVDIVLHACSLFSSVCTRASRGPRESTRLPCATGMAGLKGVRVRAPLLLCHRVFHRCFCAFLTYRSLVRIITHTYLTYLSA